MQYSKKALDPWQGQRAGGSGGSTSDDIGKSSHPTFKGFRMVPDALWLDSRLKANDIRLWCAMSFTARTRDHTEATDATLAEMLGSSPRTIRDSLARLEYTRFITRRRDGEVRVITLNPEGDGQMVPELQLRVVG